MIAKIRWGMALGLPVLAFGLFGFLVAQEPTKIRPAGSPPAPEGKSRPQEIRDFKGHGRPGGSKAGPQGRHEFKGHGRPGGSKASPFGRYDFKGHGRPGFQGGPGGFPGWPKAGPMGGVGVGVGAFALKKIEPVQPDKDVAAWIKVLADKMTDRHDQIRESSRKALVDLGASAILPLRELTKSSDTATAIAAKNVLKRIEGPGRDVLKLDPMMQGKAQFQIRIDGAKGFGEHKKMEVPLPGGGKARIEIHKFESTERKTNTQPEKAKERSKEEPKGKESPRGEFRKEGSKGGPPNPEKILSGLNLDADKRKKVEDILFSHQQRMREFIEKNRPTSPEDKQKFIPQMREMQEGLMKALREVLNNDQMQSLLKQMPGFGGPLNKGDKGGSKE